MKKVLIPFILLAYAANTVGQIPFGIKGGINRNEVVVENAPFQPLSLYRPNIGFHVGVFTRLRLSRSYLNPELLFVQRGCNSSSYLFGGFLQPVSDTRINLNYIELPILLTFLRIKALSLETGPNASIKLSAKEISDNGKKDVSDRFNKPIDWGINFGMKVNIISRFSLVGRYYHGFFPVLQFPRISPNTFPTSSSKTIQFGMHYFLR